MTTALATARAPAPAPAHRRAEAFLVRTAQLLHAHGTPSDRLERLLARMAAVLDLPAQLLSTPTSIFVAFDDEAGQRVQLLRVEPGDADLGKLVELDELLEDLEDGRTTLDAARAGLERLAGAGPRHGRALRVIAFAGVAAAAAAAFGGGVTEMAGALLTGSVLGLLLPWLAARAQGARTTELVAAFAAALLAGLLVRGHGPTATHIVTLSSLIALVPGLTLTVAAVELTSRHLVAGVARLADAMTGFLMIALGVALGRALALWCVGAPPPAALEPVGPTVSWLAMLASPLGFLVLFQARWRELGWIFAASVAGLVAARAGSEAGPELGSFAGALAVGTVANLFARWRDRPATVPMLPGILMLVPGSVGYRALDLFLARDALAGLDAAFEVAIVAAALAGGLLGANALLPPRRAL